MLLVFFSSVIIYYIYISATGKKSVAAMPEERAESPTQQAPKDPDEKIIIESHENGIRALATTVSNLCK